MSDRIGSNINFSNVEKHKDTILLLNQYPCIHFIKINHLNYDEIQCPPFSVIQITNDEY